MKTNNKLLLRVLNIFIFLEFLINRLLFRMGTYIPKNEFINMIVNSINYIGPVILNISVLLMIIVFFMTLIKTGETCKKKGFLNVLVMICVISFLIVNLISNNNTLNLLYLLLFVATALITLLEIFKKTDNKKIWLSFMVIYGTVIIGNSYILLQNIGYNAYDIFLMGEFMYFITPVALVYLFFISQEKNVTQRNGIMIALVCAVGLSILFIKFPEMTSVLLLWTLGITMTIPWYIFLFGFTSFIFLVYESKGNNASFHTAVFCLFFGGLSPQNTYQQLLLILGVWLLFNTFLQTLAQHRK